MTGRTFTPAEDRILLDGWAAGLSWAVIGAKLGHDGQRVRLSPHAQPAGSGSELVQVRCRPVLPPSRPILPPGAPVSRHAITIGTLLKSRPFT
ncbi:MAG: hypothetical protein ACRYHQ_05010 [Janthinobacterium lividum]